jgi:sugar-specific transcriptional regulator TrmB
MSIKTTLQGLGLQEKEAAIYLSLLELGESSVAEISKKSRIKRPTAYLILQALEEKGFVSKVMKERKKIYTPEQPRKLITETQLKLNEIQEIMPQLESLFLKKEGKPRVVMYEGKDQLDHAYDESFFTSGEVLYMSTLKYSRELFPKTFKKAEKVDLYPDYRAARQLLDESQESRDFIKEYKNPFLQTRFIPKEFLPFEIDMGIFGNKTLITSVKKEYFTISIESKEIANAFRSLFEAMWKLSLE